MCDFFKNLSCRSKSTVERNAEMKSCPLRSGEKRNTSFKKSLQSFSVFSFREQSRKASIYHLTAEKLL